MLLSDTGSGYLTPTVTPGSSGSVANSQCTVNGTGSSTGTSGNNLTLNLSLTFAATFTGAQNVYLQAVGKTANSNSGWVLDGTYTPAPNVPTNGGIAQPEFGFGIAQAFTMVYGDPNGIADLKEVYLLINSALGSSNGCYVEYYPATNLIYLLNDAGSATLSPAITPGVSGSVSNDQCTVNGTGSLPALLVTI